MKQIKTAKNKVVTNNFDQSRKFPSISYGRLLLLVLGTVIGSLVIGLILKQNRFTLPFDRFFYELIYMMPHPQWLTNLTVIFDHNFLPIARPHPSFLVTIYMCFLLYMIIRKRSLFWWALLSIVIGLAISRILVFVDTATVFRIRPFYILPNHLAQSVKDGLQHWTSYPSGHTRDSMLIATILAFFIPRLKYLFFVLPLFVGFSRVYLGVHFPTDVLSGLLLGYAAGAIAILVVGNIKKQKESAHKSK